MEPTTSKASTISDWPAVLITWVVRLAVCGVCLWSIGWIASSVAAAYTPLPVGDHWCYWFDRATVPSFLKLLFKQHNEHRIFTTRIVFLLDEYFLHGKNQLCFLAIIAVQILHAVLLYFWLPAKLVGARIKWLWFGILFALMLAPQQHGNFLWAFQVQFVLVYLLASLSCWLMAKYADTNGTKFLTLSLVSAFLTTYSMSNGVLIWPVLVGQLLLSRPRIWPVVATIIFGLLSMATFFYGYQTPSHHRPLSDALFQLPKVSVFAFSYIGSLFDEPLQLVFSPFRDIDPQQRVAYCCVAGMFLIFLYVRKIVGAFSSPKGPYRNAIKGMAGAMLFILGTAVLTAIGRATFQDLSESLTSRYTTPSLVLFALYLISVSAEWNSSNAGKKIADWAVGSTFALVLIVSCLGQPNTFLRSKSAADDYRRAEDALRAGVHDEPAWRVAFLNLGLEIRKNAINYLQSNHLSVYSSPDTALIGKPITDIFHTTDRHIEGFVDSAAPFPGDSMGYQIIGWSTDIADPAPRLILLTDKDGIIKGVSRNRLIRPDVKTALQTRVGESSGWVLYAANLVAGSHSIWVADQKKIEACRLMEFPLR